MVAWAGLVLLGCGPDVVDTSNVYPRNCGEEGPVDLLELDPVPYLQVERAGEHYLIEILNEDEEVEYWAAPRCGPSPVLLDAGPSQTTTRIAAGGDYLLTCDEDTGVMQVVDPEGVKPRRPLPQPVHGCRVVPLAGGLAAQEKDTGTVWFHPDPMDPEAVPILVTDDAVVPDASWTECFPRFDCEPVFPMYTAIRRAGDELLVVLDAGGLIAFSGSSGSTRMLDHEPVSALDVLGDGRLLVVDRDFGPTFIVERETGDRFEFCCADSFSPIGLLGDWLVRGSGGVAPVLPEPESWTVFRSHHLPSGVLRKVQGRDAWDPLTRVSKDTLLVDIGPAGGEHERHVVWPATDERQPVDLPGERLWSYPGRDGAYALEATETGDILRYLPGPGQSAKVLTEDAQVAFATRQGRIVYQPAGEPTDTRPLSVLLPDHERVEIASDALAAVEVSFWGSHWPVDRDEVVYVAEDEGRMVVRRTVLP